MMDTHMSTHGLFMSREKRDEFYAELCERFGEENVTRGVTTNQQLHPMYVNDWDEERDGKLDRGFGNTQYRTHFSKLYIAEVKSHQR